MTPKLVVLRNPDGTGIVIEIWMLQESESPFYWSVVKPYLTVKLSWNELINCPFGAAE